MKKYFKLITLSVVTVFALALGLFSGCGLISGKLWTDVEYNNEESYTIGSGEIAETISDININWADDALTVAYYEGTSIKIEESADKEITEDLTLRYLVDGGKLTVQFAANGRHDIRGLNKKLNVLIPTGVYLNSLTLKNVAGEINTQVNAETVKANNTSGNTIIGGNVVNVDTTTVSGKTTISQATPTTIIVKSGTGAVDVTIKGAFGLVINTVSGNVNITLPDTFGFKLTFNTTSGKLDSELDLTPNGMEYTRLEGGAIFMVNTVTGNVNISKKS